MKRHRERERKWLKMIIKERKLERKMDGRKKERMARLLGKSLGKWGIVLKTLERVTSSHPSWFVRSVDRTLRVSLALVPPFLCLLLYLPLLFL